MVNSEATRINDPVWEVHDLRRTCRLNFKYWSTKLSTNQFWSRCSENLVAVTAPSSAVSGLLFWETPVGHKIWVGFTVVTALLAVAHRVSGVTEKITCLQKVAAAYRTLECQLESLVGDIRRHGSYSDQHVEAFKRIQQQIEIASNEEPIEKLDGKLRKVCYEETLAELPVGSLFLPPLHHERSPTKTATSDQT